MNRQQNRRGTTAGSFKKGQSGNPAGKPKGARNRLTVLAEKMTAKDAAAVIEKVIESAKAGDMTAARLIFERIAPVRRGAPVQFPMPEIASATDLVPALGAILNAVAAGELTPEEGVSIAGLIESKRKAMEIVELEERVAAIEQGMKITGATP